MLRNGKRRSGQVLQGKLIKGELKMSEEWKEASRDINEKMEKLKQSAIDCSEDYPDNINNIVSDVNYYFNKYPKQMDMIRQDLGRKFSEIKETFNKNCKIVKR